MKHYYKSMLVGGTEDDRNKFYDLLSWVEDNSVGSKSEWDGDYLKTTYSLSDDTEAIYLENMEYGIPHSIDIKEK